MIAVSEKFETNIYPVSGRKMVARLTFSVINPEAQASATAQLTSTVVHPTHRDNQSLGDDFELKRLATVNPGYLRLDGTHHIEPSSDEIDEDNLKVGMNFGLSDANGEFVAVPSITIRTPLTHSFAGLVIEFDPDAFPRAMDIKAYRGSELVVTAEVLDNTESHFVLSQQFDRVDRIEIRILNIGIGYASCRVGNIRLGIIEKISENELVSVKVIEEYGLLPETVPSNEITFEIANVNKRFNMLNPSGLYRYLMERQQIDLKFGLKVGEQIECVPVGTYFLHKWGTGTDGTSAKFTGRNMLEFYRDIMIDPPTDVANYDALVKYIINQINPKQKVEIPADYVSLTYITSTYTKPTRAIEMLQHIALATRKTIRFKRDGAIVFEDVKPFVELPAEHQYYFGEGYFLGEVNLSKIRQYEGVFIAEKDMYRYPKMEILEGVKTISVRYGENQHHTIESERHGREIKVNNPLIINQSHAAEVAEWLKMLYRYRLKWFIDWRNNPAIEPSDIVIVQDRFQLEQPSRVLRQEFTYNGAFKGRTVTAGVPYGV